MIATSPDGQWAAIRRGRELSLLAGGAGPATARIELATDDADVIIVGPPSVVAVVTRGAGINRVTLYLPPYLDAVAQHELEAPMRIAAVTGPRLALLALDGSAVLIVRIAGRAMSMQPIDPGGPIEFAVGLERNQVLLGLHKKLEAWDAVSCRPLLRMQLPLPPAPRVLGQAHGHLWAIQPHAEYLLICRMSDGRPFRHYIGAPINEVISHPASPLVIAVTRRGLVRLHCFAHSLTVIDSPWQPGTPLGQLVVGEDISLLGLTDGDDEPWRVPIGGAGAPAITLEAIDAAGEAPMVTAADKLRAMRERDGTTAPGATSEVPAVAAPRLSPVAAAIAASRNDAVPLAGAASEPPSKPAAPRSMAAAIAAARGDSAPVAVPKQASRENSAPVAVPKQASREGSAPVAVPKQILRDDGAAVARREDSPPALRPAPREDLARPAPREELARPAPPRRAPEASRTAWRAPVAAYGAEVVGGAGDAELPVVAADTELGQLAQRLALPGAARRAMIALYGLYLQGEAALPIARLAQLVDDWREPLGQGELARIGLIRRRGGRVGLRAAVCDALDGAPPRAIRWIGEAGDAAPAAGLWRVERAGRSDAAIAAELAARHGRLAVLDAPGKRGALEARLHGGAALALACPAHPPPPWPREATLFVVVDGSAPAWAAALPAL